MSLHHPYPFIHRIVLSTGLALVHWVRSSHHPDLAAVRARTRVQERIRRRERSQDRAVRRLRAEERIERERARALTRYALLPHQW
ncbi:hypothetical protein [Brevibacterium litoralis]|uniref:hypothetical protein n=1 Tax=Brevibacterium litoralis TaxID=3138935 RepID=UPI0032ED52F0